MLTEGLVDALLGSIGAGVLEVRGLLGSFLRVTLLDVPIDLG